MRKLIIMAILVGLLISCVDHDIYHSHTFTPGTYKGQLLIDGLAEYPTLDVTLTFTNNRFSISGYPDFNPNYAINPTCNNGAFTITGQEIEFTTDCTLPNDPGGWFAAINGKFQINVDNRQVVMSKGSWVTYNLKLQ